MTSKLPKCAACFAALTLAFGSASAAPFIPRDGNEVLERLRSVAFDAGLRELRGMRQRLAACPTNLTLAVQYAKGCIERARADADPRYLGRAEAGLAPWWFEPVPPIDALVLRATIKQSRHEFTNALADLELAGRLAPRNPQAWLTRATVLAVVGRYAEARHACLPLMGQASALIVTCAAANIGGLTGDAEHSCRLVEQALAHEASAAPAERLWAYELLAETSARLGHTNEAREWFTRALALSHRDPYLLGAYADFLLDCGMSRDCATLLAGETRADGLLLRLALAESEFAPGSAAFEAHVAALKARFEASRLRGDRVHQREEARFTLHLLHEPVRALEAAEANWQVQREPADVRILLETALAAHQPAAARPALEFARTNHLEDRTVAALASKISLLTQK